MGGFGLGLSQGYVLGEQADWAEAWRQAGLGLELARRIEARQFEVGSLIHVALAENALGDTKVAEEHAKQAVRIVDDIGTGFAGAWSQGALARVSHSAEEAKAALLAGERMLSDDCFFYSYVHYCRHAIEACLDREWWSQAVQYCDRLQEFSSSRPTPFASFFVVRGRALSALAMTGPKYTTLEELKRLRDSAKTAGLRDALPKIEHALTKN